MKKILSSLILSLFLFAGLTCTRSALISVYKSSDLGTSWEQVKITSISGKRFVKPTGPAHSIAFDTLNPRNVFLGVKNQGIFFSSDGGLSWEKKSEGIDMDRNDSYFYRIKINPQDSNQILVAGITRKYGKIYKSIDGGEHWKQVLVESRANYAIVDLDQNSTKVVAGSQIGNVYSSRDFGDSWDVVGQFEDSISSVSISNSGVIYISTDNTGAYKSADEGQNWLGITQAINEMESDSIHTNNLSVFKIRLSPSDNMVVYLASKKGIFVSRDGGIAWENIMALLPPEGNIPTILELKVHPQNSNVVFYAVKNIIYKGVTDGSSWKSQQISLGINAFDIEFDPANSDTVYATAAGD